MAHRPTRDVVTDALLWSWTNANGWLPDKNTMTEDEIIKYEKDYLDIIRRAILERTGKEPMAATIESNRQEAGLCERLWKEHDGKRK